MPECYNCGTEKVSMRVVSELDIFTEDHDWDWKEDVDKEDSIPEEYEGEHLCEDCLEQYDGYVGSE